MREVSEREIKVTIGLMRSMANQPPVSPFHLKAAEEMECMLKEILALRKQVEEAKRGDH